MIKQSKFSGRGMTSLRTRQRLVERLAEKGIKDVRILEAMRDIPRHLFLDEALASRAYEDLALPIGYQQTISQPYIVARMTEALIEQDKLNGKPIKNALEIGTGCGYQTAILARFSEKVLSLERLKSLYLKAKSNLNKLKVRNIRLMHDDGQEISKMDGKFDAILSAAAPLDVPVFLLNKLSIGGRLIMPLGGSSKQELTLIKREDRKTYTRIILDEVLFVPMLGGTSN